jgi:ABC-type Zn2+ transport system substrate-binding protein/surface adhesin
LARKNRSLASFADVANIDNNKDNNNQVNNHINNKDNENVNVNEHDDEIDNILKNDNKTAKIQKGIYFEPEVAKALDKLVKKKLQSEFVNAAVKKVLKEKGLL